MPEKRSLAVVTMVFNESFMLPFWVKHYGTQVGRNHCFVIDHGSDDGSTADIAAQVLVLPRSPHDEHQRAAACSQICAMLLYFYERVIYCDVDEILVVDPDVAPTLNAYAALDDVPQVVTAIGMDLLHDESHEGPLSAEITVLRQRSLARAFSNLCKPAMTSIPLHWGTGFHRCEETSEYYHLYMFHLAYADFGEIARRQIKRNSVTFHCENGRHHSIPPDAMVAHIRNDYMLPVVVNTELRHEDPPVAKFLAMSQPPNGISRNAHQEDVLWRLPERFSASLERAAEGGKRDNLEVHPTWGLLGKVWNARARSASSRMRSDANRPASSQK